MPETKGLSEYVNEKYNAAHQYLDRLGAPRTTKFGEVSGRTVVAERIRLFIEPLLSQRDELLGGAQRNQD